jgi:DNA invertase Pin-like site-specific DNA recombinase
MYEDVKNVVLYVRYSSSNQTEQSIEGQTRVCTEFCERLGFQIVQIYADRATSASKDIEKRVNFLKMIEDSEKRKFDAVVVYKLDRFARSRYDMATYKYKLRKNGVQLISATENISNDPEGIILESVLEGMAEFYSAELSQKINRGLRETALKHNFIGGHPPLGYKVVDKKYVIDPITAPMVVEAYEMYANGATIAEIIRTFNEKGYRTSRNTKFNKSSFTRMFRNEKYIGAYSFHEYKAENALEPIISKELWDKVQMRLEDQKPSGTYKAKRTYLLSGKLFCGHCGNRMNGNSNGTDYFYYECYGKKMIKNDCTKRNMRKDFIEKVVVEDALSLLTDENIEMIADTAVKLNNKELAETTNIPVIKSRLKEVNTTLNNIMKAIETGEAPEMLVKRMSELEKEQRKLTNQLKEEEKTIIYVDKPKVIFWLEKFRQGDINNEMFMKQLIDLFVNSVTVWDEDDTHFKITIAYNITPFPTKTYRLNKDGTIGFIPDTSTFEVKSDILIHTIRKRLNPHRWSKFNYKISRCFKRSKKAI